MVVVVEVGLYIWRSDQPWDCCLVWKFYFSAVPAWVHEWDYTVWIVRLWYGHHFSHFVTKEPKPEIASQSRQGPEYIIPGLRALNNAAELPEVPNIHVPSYFL